MDSVVCAGEFKGGVHQNAQSRCLHAPEIQPSTTFERIKGPEIYFQTIVDGNSRKCHHDYFAIFGQWSGWHKHLNHPHVAGSSGIWILREFVKCEVECETDGRPDARRAAI